MTAPIPRTAAAGYAAVTRARLVPPRPAVAPAGDDLLRVELRFGLGLPHRFRLDDELDAVLLLPTGLATEWRDLPADDEVSTSAAQRTPSPEDLSAGEPPAAPPARLVIRSAGQVIGVVALVAGARALVSGGPGPVRALLEVVDWGLRAGAVRGPGDTASSLVLRWRRADRAVEQYSVPPPPRRVRARLRPEYRIESDLGLHVLPIHTTWSKAKWAKTTWSEAAGQVTP